jgi:hypothetical protein
LFRTKLAKELSFTAIEPAAEARQNNRRRVPVSEPDAFLKHFARL